MKSFKEFLVEQKQIDEKYEVEVSVRDARKAQDIAQDMFRGTYKNKGSNVYVFKKEDDYEDFVDTLKQHKIEILKEQIDEAVVSKDAKKIVLKDVHGGDLTIGITKNTLTIYLNKEMYVVSGKEFDAFKELVKGIK